eukprot:TRINITY_DN2021_c0_g1_i3.p1 TRINITY_DN2021_c0_g1~~TRINITY_DN2021_c0_g1_i3.p1  ORF type:complete len:1118 (+),score=293.46 TRINITY_DN2021_c0_g1_i3:2598-5951(+)
MDIIHSGWVYFYDSAWRKCFMVLVGNTLSLFRTESMQGSYGTFYYKDLVAVGPVNHKDKQYAFNVISTNSIWVLAAIQPQEREIWIQKIQTKIPKHGVRQEPPKPGLKKTTTNATNTRVVSPPQGNKPQGTISKSATSKSLTDRLRALGNLKQNMDRSFSKNKTYFKGTAPIGHLFVSVMEAKFDDNADIDPLTRPFCSAYFERQLIESKVSKNARNPHWKDNFKFDVFNIESRLKLKVYNSIKSPEHEMGDIKIPIKHLNDGKQHRRWYEMISKFGGSVLLSWRFEKFKGEDKTDVYQELSLVKGTAQLMVIGAKNLKVRKGGSNPRASVQITYGKQEFSPEPIDSTDPQWNFGVILRVRDESETCIIRVVDVSKVSKDHLGTALIPSAQLLKTQETQRWIKLGLDPEDDPGDNRVRGELLVKYRFKPSGATLEEAKREAEAEITSMMRNITDTSDESIKEKEIPTGFPAPPPDIHTDQSTSSDFEKNYYKKLMREKYGKSMMVYQQKMSEGDEQGAQQVVNDLNSKLAMISENMNQDKINEDEELEQKDGEEQQIVEKPVIPEARVDFSVVPEGFPPAPPKIDVFFGDTEEQYEEFVQMKRLREAWEEGLITYRKKEAVNDTQGMLLAIQQLREKFRNTSKITSSSEKRKTMRMSMQIPYQIQDTTPKPIPPVQNSPDNTNRLSSGSSGSPNQLYDTLSSSSSSAEDRRSNRLTTGKSRTATRGRKAGFLDPNALKALNESITQVELGGNSEKVFESIPEDAQGSSYGESTISGSTINTMSTFSHDIIEDHDLDLTYQQANYDEDNSFGMDDIGDIPGFDQSEYDPQYQDDGQLTYNGSSEDPDNQTFTSSNAESDKAFQEHVTEEVTIELFDPATAISMEEEQEHDISYKVIIIGSPGVGKSSLLYQYIMGEFLGDLPYVPCLDFATINFGVEEQVVRVQIWDTAGQEVFGALGSSFFRQVDGVLVVYDSTSPDSFADMDIWLEKVLDIRETINSQLQISLVANKADLKNQRLVPRHLGKDYAQMSQVKFYETSAYNGANVHYVFQTMLQEIHEKVSQTNRVPKGIKLSTDHTPVLDQSCCTSPTIVESLGSISDNISTTFGSLFGGSGLSLWN